MEDIAGTPATLTTQRGWPSPDAVAAAVAVHAAVLAWLVAHPTASLVRDHPAALTVRLVAPPADPTSPAAPAPAAAQPDGRERRSEPPAAKPKSLGKPSAHARRSQGERTRQKRKEEPSRGVYTREGSEEAAQGTAVYQVLVGSGGTIQSIVLARSSGTPSYDAAGVAMIRNSMTFDPPPAGSPGAVAMIVTINFSPAADRQ